eukprot:PhF_6_TR15668/c0_g1_i2/m.24357
MSTVQLRVRGKGGSSANMIALRIAIQDIPPSNSQLEVIVDATGASFRALWNEIASIFDVCEYNCKDASVIVKVIPPPPYSKAPEIAINVADIRNTIPTLPTTQTLCMGLRRVVVYCALIGISTVVVNENLIESTRNYLKEIGLPHIRVSDGDGLYDLSTMYIVRFEGVPSNGSPSERLLLIPNSEESDDDEGGKREGQVIGKCECLHDH